MHGLFFFREKYYSYNGEQFLEKENCYGYL